MVGNCFVAAAISSPFISSPLEATAFQAHLLGTSSPPLEQRQSVKRMTIGDLPPITATATAGGAGGRELRQDPGKNSSGIRVTLALRGAGRTLLNLQDVLTRLRGTYGVDTHWLATHVVDMELHSFPQQVTRRGDIIQLPCFFTLLSVLIGTCPYLLLSVIASCMFSHALP